MLGNLACFLSSDDCFEKQLFQKFLSGKLSVTNSLDQDQAYIISGLIQVQIVFCEGYQQMILEGNESEHHFVTRP